MISRRESRLRKGNGALIRSLGESFRVAGMKLGPSFALAMNGGEE
jgi:hypothetical protein